MQREIDRQMRLPEGIPGQDTIFIPSYPFMRFSVGLFLVL